ncbi:MAG TPA: hypothetical protein VHC90_24205 [Bryobacteraceae bacterium]|nr:hypothetical protein [Bryobacteraceae bacterium]
MPAVLSSQSGARTSRTGLWFGATAAAIAWALEGVINEVISAEACRSNTENWGPLSATGTKLLLGSITAVAFAVAVAAIIISFRNWWRMAESHDFIHAEAQNRKPFMGLVGVIAGVLLACGIVWSGIPLIFLDICVKAR